MAAVDNLENYFSKNEKMLVGLKTLKYSKNIYEGKNIEYTSDIFLELLEIYWNFLETAIDKINHPKLNKNGKVSSYTVNYSILALFDYKGNITSSFNHFIKTTNRFNRIKVSYSFYLRKFVQKYAKIPGFILNQNMMLSDGDNLSESNVRSLSNNIKLQKIKTTNLVCSTPFNSDEFYFSAMVVLELNPDNAILRIPFVTNKIVEGIKLLIEQYEVRYTKASNSALYAVFCKSENPVDNKIKAQSCDLAELRNKILIVSADDSKKVNHASLSGEKSKLIDLPNKYFIIS